MGCLELEAVVSYSSQGNPILLQCYSLLIFYFLFEKSFLLFNGAFWLQMKMKAVIGRKLNPLQAKFERISPSGKRDMQSSFSQESRFVFNYSCLFVMLNTWSIQL